MFYEGCMNSRVAIFAFLSLLQKSSIQYLIENLMNGMYSLKKTRITASLLVSIMSERLQITICYELGIRKALI